jgi:hypothetical protein
MHLACLLVFQVAYTTAYGSVVPNYGTEPVIPEDHVDANSGVFHMNEEDITFGDEVVGAGYEQTAEVYTGASFPVAPDGLLPNGDCAFSETASLAKMVSHRLSFIAVIFCSLSMVSRPSALFLSFSHNIHNKPVYATALELTRFFRLLTVFLVCLFHLPIGKFSIKSERQ